MKLFFSILFSSFIFSPAALGQIGDKSDRAGEVQKLIVPKELIPPSPALSPADALKAFQFAERGFRIELVASEPMIQEPVAAQFDHEGKLWVVEMRGFMNNFEGSNEDAPIGRVVILSDFLGDADATRRAAEALVASGSDVHAVHVIASEELELPRESALYTDPEDATLVRPFDPEAQRAYAERFGAWREESARAWRLAGATYTEVVTREDAARSVRRIARDAAAARA